ncbi:hypothetical protein ACFO9Q_04165 [Paenibacillus sp. GCM10023252]|uniref:hypothetical protein n=1 Tax=Paenibacillus sp. GCM10023252 TaxID=3252649 RepID=UPI0036211FAA
MRSESSKPWNWLLFPFTSVQAAGGRLYAASAQHGVYCKGANQDWMPLEGGGMQDGTTVNRLKELEGRLSACTNTGLYHYIDGKWQDDGLAIPCYQYARWGQISYAATEYGVWCKRGLKWQQCDYTNKRVYDLLQLPQYLVIGHEEGLSLYDRFMDEWADFRAGSAVTSVAVYNKRIIGTNEHGELLAGDGEGRFNRIRYGRQFLYSVKCCGKGVYVCTDRGLYSLSEIGGRLILQGRKLGYPVTDIDLAGDEMMLATLYQGVQFMPV